MHVYLILTTICYYHSTDILSSCFLFSNNIFHIFFYLVLKRTVTNNAINSLRLIVYYIEKRWHLRAGNFVLWQSIHRQLSCPRLPALSSFAPYVIANIIELRFRDWPLSATGTPKWFAESVSHLDASSTSLHQTLYQLYLQDCSSFRTVFDCFSWLYRHSPLAASCFP